jgi:hypothetical protein
MGCDIHATLEKKRYWDWETKRRGETGNDYNWESAGYPWEPRGSTRSYAMFSILGQCGRNPDGQVSISEYRGFPRYAYESSPEGESYCDLSDEFKAYYKSWERDAHSPGYATLRELQLYRRNGFPTGTWVDRATGELDLLIRRMERVAEEYDGDPDAVRIVFFFDN